MFFMFFIFLHFSSFFFFFSLSSFFLGSSKSDFSWPQCFKISCDISFREFIFFEPSFGVPLWALFSFFLLSIFPSLFFLLLLIFHFFSRKKFLLFFFSSTSFHKCFIAASVSEFNCFLRSRCAPWRCGVLTTWSGDSWDWFGRLLGGEHDSTPQSGVEAPGLLKRSLSGLYCCCFCFVFVVVFVVGRSARVCPHHRRMQTTVTVTN